MSLISEKPIVFNPSLAATLGLEEAVLLTVLGECWQYYDAEVDGDRAWLRMSRDRILCLLPFWSDADIQRILRNLVEQGVIELDSPPLTEADSLRFSLDLPAPAQPVDSKAAVSAGRGANLISPHWQPSEDLIQRLGMHNIPREYVQAQVDEFVLYWRERRDSAHAWSSKFLTWVIRQWRSRDSDFLHSASEGPKAIERSWQPSSDAVDILVRAGIDQQFIDDSIPEFVLYWQERGEVGKTWNSKFIQHIRRQWSRFHSSMGRDSEPQVIASDWQPSEDLFDILRMANIDEQFARGAIPEFVLYWRDSQLAHNSWNSKFLQHIKKLWAQQHQMATGQADAGRQDHHQPRSTRDRTLSEDLSDRSWAN